MGFIVGFIVGFTVGQGTKSTLQVDTFKSAEIIQQRGLVPTREVALQPELHDGLHTGSESTSTL